MSRHPMPFGATVLDGTRTAFRFFAPQQTRVVLEFEPPVTNGAPAARHAMSRTPDGWHELTLDAPVGSRYGFVLADGLQVPDPASRSNPDGVHGMSEVVDPDHYEWLDADWTGRPWSEAVICEIHVGTFTEAGTFAAAAERLADLATTGYSVVELMPLSAFAGERGWGYDGVLHFAPHHAYGTPDDLRSFVDRAHALGLMVMLDVVYNHFGPEGNFLHGYAPEFFSRTHETPWGSALNFDAADSGAARGYFRHNALYWIEEFHLDGLRIDAVHGMVDDSSTHIVREIAAAVRDGPGRARQVHLVVENDANQASLLERGAAGAPICMTAQWNDDFHHAAHVILTGETAAYYVDYAPHATDYFARALAEGFAYQGEPSKHRDGAPRGEPSAHLPATAFVSFLQNHDQIGNRVMGDRLSAPQALVEAMYVCLLLSPQIPLLFMGEEFAASAPFLYFCDFEPELASAVSNGRRAEFAGFAAMHDELKEPFPEPGAIETFQRSKLHWSQRREPFHAERLAFIRQLLALRRQHLMPRLTGTRRGGGRGIADDKFLQVRWDLPDGSRWSLFANLGTETREVEIDDGTTLHERGTRYPDSNLRTFETGATLVSVADAAMGKDSRTK